MGRIQVRYLAQLFIVLSSTLAFAREGGWVSGGGQDIGNSRNPWFIENTEQVRYCVKIDELNFGAPRDFVEGMIPVVIQSWKAELSRFEKISSCVGFCSRVGTQEFIKTECDSDTDLVFQFGVLDEVQSAYLGDPTTYVGAAVRTIYDEVTLKGKGFVYIAPAEGPLRYKGIDSTSNPWLCKSWISVPNAELPCQTKLFLALLHEMGHVFGFPHWDEGVLMAEDFSQRLMESGLFISHGLTFEMKNSQVLLPESIPLAFVFPYLGGETKQSLVSYRSTHINGIPEHAQKFFGLDSSWNRLDIRIDSAGSGSLESGYVNPIQPAPPPGEVPTPPALNSVGIFSLRLRHDILKQSRVVLTEAQKVYPPRLHGAQMFNYASGVADVTAVGEFIANVGGARRSVSLRVEQPTRISDYMQPHFVLGGVLDGIYVPNLLESGL